MPFLPAAFFLFAISLGAIWFGMRMLSTWRCRGILWRELLNFAFQVCEPCLIMINQGLYKRLDGRRHLGLYFRRNDGAAGRLWRRHALCRYRFANLSPDQYPAQAKSKTNTPACERLQAPGTGAVSTRQTGWRLIARRTIGASTGGTIGRRADALQSQIGAEWVSQNEHFPRLDGVLNYETAIWDMVAEVIAVFWDARFVRQQRKV